MPTVIPPYVCRFLLRNATYATLMRVTHIVLALAHPHPTGAASRPGTGTYWFAIGLLVGMIAMRVAPGWLVGVIFAADIVAVGWSFGILHYADTGNGRWVWVALVFLLIGLYVGVMHGLQHLSVWEYTSRLKNIRSMGKKF
jgi:hypothetical protein